MASQLEEIGGLGSCLLDFSDSNLAEPLFVEERISKFLIFRKLTHTDEDSKLVHRRRRPKVDTLFSCFFPTRPSDEYDSAPSRKYSHPFLDVFACIG